MSVATRETKMVIPRAGSLWVIRRGKAKRKVVIEVERCYRREPNDIYKTERCKTRHFYVVLYKTRGTWAGHGRRSATVRNFLGFAVPK